MRENALPKAELRDNKLYVEGVAEAFVRGAIRHFKLDVRNLKLHRQFSIDEGQLRAGSRIAGRGIIDLDSLAIAGDKRPAVREITFAVRPVSEQETKHHWGMSIGFLPNDWEIGTDDHWYFESYVPQPVFDRFEREYLTGKVGTLSVGATTNLWVGENDWYAPVGVKVVWYLAPQTDRQSDMPDHAVGKIDSFAWDIDVKPEPIKDPYQMGRDFADETLRDLVTDAPKPNVPQPQKKKWNWAMAAAIASAIAVVLLLSK